MLQKSHLNKMYEKYIPPLMTNHQKILKIISALTIPSELPLFFF